MADKDKGGASAPAKSRVELAKEGQLEAQEIMNASRIEFLETLTEFNSIGGKNDVKSGVLKIVGHFTDGIPFLFLQTVYPEITLTKARKELIGEGKIQRSEKRGTS